LPESGLNFIGNARELSSLTFLTAGTQFPPEMNEQAGTQSSQQFPQDFRMYIIIQSLWSENEVDQGVICVNLNAQELTYVHFVTSKMFHLNLCVSLCTPVGCQTVRNHRNAS